MDSLSILEIRCRDLEQELEDSRRQLDTLIRNVPDIIYMLDAEGKIVFISDNIRQYGYSPGQLIGKHIIELIHPHDREKAMFRINERRTGDRKTTAFEIQLLTGSNEAVPVEINTSNVEEVAEVTVTAEGYYLYPFEEKREFKGTVGIARDLSRHVAGKETYDRMSELLHRWSDYLPICSSCKKVRDTNSEWHTIEEFFDKELHVKLTHTICHDCSTKLYPELDEEK